MNSTNIILLAVNLILSVGGQLSIKYGINQIASTDTKVVLLNAVKNPFVILGIASYGFAMILWITILSRINISIAYPTLSLGYILILFFSWKFLGEEITHMKVIGVLLIIIGVIFLFRGN